MRGLPHALFSHRHILLRCPHIVRTRKHIISTPLRAALPQERVARACPRIVRSAGYRVQTGANNERQLRKRAIAGGKPGVMCCFFKDFLKNELTI